MKPYALLAVGLVAGATLGAGGTAFVSGLPSHGGIEAPYAEQDQRPIASLSAEDIAELRAGAGWGLAKPAELDGYSGPTHVLDAADELDLSAEQHSRITQSYEGMRSKARGLGAELIDAERAIDAAFEEATATPEMLRTLLTDAAAIRAALRETHLSAHLEIEPLLSVDQRQRYASLRGYGESAHQGH